MSNPFHYSELLYPLTKGDTAGHPFHGNQYTAGQGGGGKDTGIWSKAQEVASNPSREGALDVADLHRQEAGRLMQLRDSTENKDNVKEYNSAVKAHIDAQKNWEKIGVYGKDGEGLENEAIGNALRSSQKALGHSAYSL